MQTAMVLEDRHKPAVEAAAQPVDRAHLARYTLGDRELEREVLELFANQTWKTIAELREAENDRAWHVAAHTLKGSARAVGAWRIAREAELAERVGGASDRSAAVDAIERIEQAAIEATAYVRHLAAVT